MYTLQRDLEHLNAPALLVAMDGWVNAGEVGTETAARIAATGETVAVFDSDLLFDYRAARPEIEFVEGSLQSVRWPELTLSLITRERDLLVLHGKEPDFRWRRLGAEVADLAHRLGVVQVVSLGGVPAAVPHTRPVRLLTTASKPDLIPEDEQLPVGVLRVPAAALNIVEHATVESGIPAVGFWAQVPHYVAGTYYPAVIALTERISRHLGVDLALGDLVDLAAEQRRELDETVAAKPEALEYLHRLEQIATEQQTLPSGEEIAAEVEKFLREAGPFDE